MLILLMIYTLPSRFYLGVPIYMLATHYDFLWLPLVWSQHWWKFKQESRVCAMSLCITSIIIAIMSCTYVQSHFHVEGVAMVTVLYYTQDLKLLSPPHECIPILFVCFFCHLRFPFY